jgi:nucleoid-associated protein YgaU
MAGSIALGEAIVTGEGEEGGFSATFIIPAETAPGSYTVTATAEDGDTTVADLTITAPSEEASAEPAMAQEPTGELHQIDRSKPLGQVITVVVVIALSAAVGFVLIRNRG